jgi:hypothetical protein
MRKTMHGILPLTLAVCLACNGSADVQVQPVLWEADAQAQRRFVALQWDSLWSIGSENDTLLFGAGAWDAGPAGLYVYEYHDRKILAIGHDGVIRWSVGRPGGGPGEFRSGRDLKVDAEGNILLNDPQNGRITIVDTTGRIRDHIQIADQPHAEVFAPLADGRIALVTAGGEAPVRFLSRQGRDVARADIPWKPFTQMSLVAKQGISVADGQRWGYLFSMGNGWFPYLGDRPDGYIGRFIEHSDFPDLVVSVGQDSRTLAMLRRQPCSACSASLRGDTLYVHFGGLTADSYGIVDLYAWSSGSYLHSIRLPRKTARLAVWDDHFYTQDEMPYPRIVAWRSRPADPRAD